MSKTFRRQHFWKYKTLGKTLKWRKPRGQKNPIRRKVRGKLPMPSVGYRSAVVKRGLHPTGLMEIRVMNVGELASLTPKYIVRISSTVGRRKRMMIFQKARQMGLKVVQQEPSKPAKPAEKPVTPKPKPATVKAEPVTKKTKNAPKKAKEKV
ncbi:MAG TPA: 50S ribosomal protein L32e [archaeon]|nr:50S ribosomal protein L32e [archaeon]